MRPQFDNSSSSSSSSYQTNQFLEQPGSSKRNNKQASDSEEQSARMLTRMPSVSPLHTNSADKEDDLSVDKFSADQQYEQAQRRLGTLNYLVNELNRAEHFDLAKGMALFGKIKGDDPALKLLAREGSEEDYQRLQQFAAGMAVCLNHFARFLTSGVAIHPGLQVDDNNFPTNSLLHSLDAQDVHQIFNGLSTLIDDGLRTHLFSKTQLNHLAKPLRDINQALIVQAMLKGLPTDLPSNACLLDILNLQSRLLKAKLVAEDNKAIRALFARSLAIIEHWPTESGVPVTEAGKVVSRQLAKTLVQLNTIRSFNLIKLDKSPAGKTNRERLGQCVLALCTEQALNELTLRRNPDKPADEPWRVPPRGVEVSNISNTVKDFLEAGYLSLNDAASYELIERIAGFFLQIPQTDLQQRAGQTLSNCGNFLRTVQECATRPQSSKTILQATAYQAACNVLLKRIGSEEFWSTMGWGAKKDQTLANTASFLKAMVKSGKADATLLQSATIMLVQQIQHFGTEKFTEAQSVSGLLSALVAIAYLAPSAPVPALLEKLLETVAQQVNGKWPAKSRAVALRAALARQDEGRSLQAVPAIDALLKAGAVHEDPLPYLQAVHLRGKDNPDRLAAFQPMLRQFPEWAQQPAAITLNDIEQAIRRLEAKEPASPPRLHVAPVVTPITTTSETVKPAEPPIPGMTHLIPPSTAAASNHFAASTSSSSSVKPIPRKRNADHSDETWGESANTLGNQKKAAESEQTSSSKSRYDSTNPVLSIRGSQNEKKSTTPVKANNARQVKKIASPTHDIPSSVLPTVLSAKTKTAITRQWFEAIQNKSMKNRLKVLAQLVQQYPALPDLYDGNVNNGRTALFYALILGDTALLECLLPLMQPMTDAAATHLLRQVIDQPILVDEAMRKAMKILLERFGTNQREKITTDFNQHPELIPVAYSDILLQFKPADSTKETAATTTSTSSTPVRNAAKKIRRAEDVRRDREHEEQRVTTQSAASESITVSNKFIKKLEASVAKAKDRNPLLTAVFYGDINAVSTLLTMPNAAIMISGTELYAGFTPLQIAIFRQEGAIAERLLKTDAGMASSTIANNTGHSPLMCAIQAGQDDIVRQLLSLPNVVEQVKMCEPTQLANALLYAVLSKKYELAHLLANIPNAEDQALQLYSQGENALFAALAGDDPNMAEILLSMPNGREQFKQIKGISQNALFNDAAAKNRTKIIKLLLEHDDVGNWLISPAVEGYNALSFSISSDFDELAEVLLNSPFGERLSLIAPMAGNIPLIIAANLGKDRIAARLLTMPTAAHQAMHRNDVGLTPLLLAVKKGHIEIVRRLIALPNAKDQASMRHNPAVFHEKFVNASREKLGNLVRQNHGEWSAAATFAKEKGITLEQYLEDNKSLEPKDINTIGMNAWQIATAKGYGEIAALLLPFEQS